MTAKRRLEENSIKGLVMVILFLFLSLKACVVKGETMTLHTLEQLLGKGVTAQFKVGLAAEYQLENDQRDFIHLFAEVACGIPVATRCTRDVFDRTHIINPLSTSVGISFGKIKQRGK